MAAGNWLFFNKGFADAIKGDIRLNTDTFRMVLITGTYAFDATDVAWSEISTNELANGNGYATHGVLAGVTVSEAAGVVKIDVDDETWASMTQSPAPQGAVIIKDANGDGTLEATDIPLAYMDLEAAGSLSDLSSQTLNVNCHANGAVTMPVPNS